MLWKVIRSFKGDIHNFTYNLLFNQASVVHTYLPAPALFDYHGKGRYFVPESEAWAHNAAVEAARKAEASAPRASMSYHSDYYPGYWLITKLGQILSLGEYVFPPTLHSCSHISFQLSVSILFHCIIHVRFILSLSSCVFEKPWENTKIFPASFLFFFLE